MTLGPFHQANKHVLPKKLLTIAIVAALMFRNGDDEQANKCIKSDDVQGTPEKSPNLKSGIDDYGLQQSHKASSKKERYVSNNVSHVLNLRNEVYNYIAEVINFALVS